MQANTVLDIYLRSYRDLIAAEQIGDSTVLSLPLHLAANHRIEITITRFGKDSYIISDSARTLGEVRAAGYAVTGRTLERLSGLASVSGLRLVDSHLVLEATLEGLGVAIQRFLEVTKTIGDVYLVHKQRDPESEELISEIRDVLDAHGVIYQLHQRVNGEIEKHPFDLVAAPNGKPGLALSVLGGQNTHSVAQIWGFKCDDVKRGEWYRRNKVRLALVYDVRGHVWSAASRAILDSRADVVLPSDSLHDLPQRLV